MQQRDANAFSGNPTVLSMAHRQAAKQQQPQDASHAPHRGASSNAALHHHGLGDASAAAHVTPDAVIARNLQSHIDATVRGQLRTIRRLRAAHSQLMRVVADVNVLCEVFCPEAAVGINLTGCEEAGAQQRHAPLPKARGDSLPAIIIPPCSEEGSDALFGRLRRSRQSTTASSSHNRGAGESAKDAVGDDHCATERGLAHTAFFAPFFPRRCAPSNDPPFPDYSHLPLHDHVMLLAAVGPVGTKGEDAPHPLPSVTRRLLSDASLHKRLLAQTQSRDDGHSDQHRRHNNNGRSKSRSPSPSPSSLNEQLRLDSFVALLPLCEAWLALSHRVGGDESPSLSSPHAPATLAQAGFVLLHEGIRQFQSQGLFTAVGGGAAASATNHRHDYHQQWSRLHAALAQCQSNPHFMRHFAWPEAMGDLVQCLSAVAHGG